MGNHGLGCKYPQTTISLGLYDLAKGTPALNLLNLFLYLLIITLPICGSIIWSEYRLCKKYFLYRESLLKILLKVADLSYRKSMTIDNGFFDMRRL